MLIKPINLFSGFKINHNVTNHAALNTQQTQNSSVKADTLTALAFRGNENLAAIKKYETPHEIKSAISNFKAAEQMANALAQSVQKEANRVVEYAQEVSEEVTELFKRGDEITSDGTVLRSITGNSTNKIMKEYNKEGALTRISVFNDDRLEMIQEGIEELSDGSRKIAKEMNFEDGELSSYYEGEQWNKDGSREVEKEIRFMDENPCIYFEGQDWLIDGTGKIAKQIRFSKGKPSLYQENYELLNNWLTKIAKEVCFIDGKPISYKEGEEWYDGGSRKIAKRIYFRNKKPVSYEEGMELLDEASVNIRKQLKLTDKGWREVVSEQLY